MNIEWLFGGDRAEGRRKRVSAASPLFPAAPGNSGDKNCRGSPCTEKSFLVNILHATFRPNRRRGRETAGKTENRRIAVWYRPSSAIVLIIFINNFWLRYMVRKHRCGKRAEVSSAPRGVKRMTGKVLGNLRDLVEYVAELWRCRGRSAAMPGAGCASTRPERRRPFPGRLRNGGRSNPPRRCRRAPNA